MRFRPRATESIQSDRFRWNCLRTRPGLLQKNGPLERSEVKIEFP